MMHKALATVGFLALLLPLQAAYALDQKVVFCGESISHESGLVPRVCQLFCKAHLKSQCIENEIADGWQVVTVTPHRVDASAGYRCECIGKQYVLKKEAKPEAIAVAVPEKPSVSPQEIALLYKEIELLKREGEMLKSENATLKQELDAAKSKANTKKK